jgi:regulatory protein
VATDQNVLRPDVPAWRTAPESDDYRSAMERAGRLLGVRALSQHQLRTRLTEAGHEAEAVDGVIARLIELALLDDLTFARDLIAERAARKVASPRALLEELAGKGIDRETAAQALAESGLEEIEQATELASRLVGRVARRPLHEQGPRLVAMLVRRGFSYEAAADGARAVLPPEGWD